MRRPNKEREMDLGLKKQGEAMRKAIQPEMIKLAKTLMTPLPSERKAGTVTVSDLLFAAKAYEKSLLKAFKGDKSEWAQSQRRACSQFVKFLTLVANGESVETALVKTA